MSETVDPSVVTPTPPPLPTPPSDARVECTNCGGAVLYTPGTSAVTCIQCASAFPIPAGEPVGAEHGLAAGLADPRAAATGRVGTGVADGELSRELVCPSCRAAVTFVGTLTATRCPFCARPVHSDDVHDAPARFPVDGIVPFGLDQKSAEKRVRQWISKRRWAPSAFKKYATTGSFAGVYLPFFTFDAETVTRFKGACGIDKMRTVERDGKKVTETYTDWTPVNGTVEQVLDDLPIPAESSLDRDRMRDLEPWPSSAAVGFRPEYLAGFLARRYDRSLEQCQVEARTRQDELIEEAIKRRIGGDHQIIHSRETTWKRESFRHLLLPVYLLVVTFRSKPYQVAVNGVTGEVHGKRPWSWVKIGAVVLAAVLAAVAFGLFAWAKSPDPAPSTSTSAFPRITPNPQPPAAAPAEPARTYTPAQCSDAVVAYRLQTPDTYFPDVPACAGLTAAQRTTIARALFDADQIAAARAAVLALDATATTRERCEAEWELAAAKTSAHQNTADDERNVSRACSGLPQATVDQISNSVADRYLERRKQALADAP